MSQIGPEHIGEDPFHGPESILRRLDTPPMPLGDGTYHVFGAGDMIGTCTFDANGKPFHRFKTTSSLSDVLREVKMIEDWLERVEAGDLPEDYPDPDFFDLSAVPYFVTDTPLRRTTLVEPPIEKTLLELDITPGDIWMDRG